MPVKNRTKLKSKKIYLVRHGQTDYNLKGIVQGSGVDAPLNKTGWDQAQQFYSHYKEVRFDKIYTSTLQRSVQSVQQFINTGIPHIPAPGLNEINWGNWEGVEMTSGEDAYYRNVLNEWKSGNTSLSIEEGESPLDVSARQKPVVEQIVSDDDATTILICMHGRAMRILLCLLMNYPLQLMDVFDHSNLCLYRLNYTGIMFNIEAFNNTKHL